MDGVLNGARVLVLEDEFLIAMDVEQLCRDHGAEDVSIVRNLTETEAFQLNAFDVAIIDVMLAGQSSLPFAIRLKESRVPFVFASGYPDADGIFETFPGIRVVNKPYASDDLIQAVTTAYQSRTDGKG